MEKRERMVHTQIAARGVKDKRVLEALHKVPRHEFVPEKVKKLAYMDSPLAIGESQTISQPYIVALMTELAELRPNDRVLEIGTGSGYQAAVLSELVKEVYTIEIIESLSRKAETLLKRLGYENIKVKTGDGYIGWKEFAPFDAVIITAAPPEIPEPLVEQLAPHGILVSPVGELRQELIVLKKKENGDIEKRSVIPVRFVPMTGKAQKEPKN